MEHFDQVKKQIYDLRWKMMHLLEQEESWEIATFRKKALEEGLREGSYNFSMIHVIDCIGRYEPINSTSIADKMELSKASITKMTSKLFDEDSSSARRLNDNKKSIFPPNSERPETLRPARASAPGGAKSLSPVP